MKNDNLINDNGSILGVDGNPATFQTIPSGEDFEDIVLSNYTIKNPNGGIDVIHGLLKFSFKKQFVS